MGFGSADIQITLKLDNSELMQLKASYTTAKTLSAMLNSTIATFEKVTKHQVMRMEEVGEAIRLHNQMESNTLPE